VSDNNTKEKYHTSFATNLVVSMRVAIQRFDDFLCLRNHGISTITIRMGMALETSVYLPLNHLPQPLAWEHSIESIRRETYSVFKKE